MSYLIPYWILVALSASQSSICVWYSVEGNFDRRRYNGEYTISPNISFGKPYWTQITPCQWGTLHMMYVNNTNGYWWMLDDRLTTSYDKNHAYCINQPPPSNPTNCTEGWHYWDLQIIYDLPMSVTNGPCPSLQCNKIELANTNRARCNKIFTRDVEKENVFIDGDTYLYFNKNTFRWYCSSVLANNECDEVNITYFVASKNQSWLEVNIDETVQWELDNDYNATFKCFAPTSVPTVNPTQNPTIHPTMDPTYTPTADPTIDPTSNPTKTPMFDPTQHPSQNPTTGPTKTPTSLPTINPTLSPTDNPTQAPTNEQRAMVKSPSQSPTDSPLTDVDKSVSESEQGQQTIILVVVLISAVAICCGIVIFGLLYRRHKQQRKDCKNDGEYNITNLATSNVELPANVKIKKIDSCGEYHNGGDDGNNTVNYNDVDANDEEEEEDDELYDTPSCNTKGRTTIGQELDAQEHDNNVHDDNDSHDEEEGDDIDDSLYRKPIAPTKGAVTAGQ